MDSLSMSLNRSFNKVQIPTENEMSCPYQASTLYLRSKIVSYKREKLKRIVEKIKTFFDTVRLKNNKKNRNEFE